MSQINLRYKFLGKLGEGGLGAAYIMEDKIVDEKCIIKFIPKRRFFDNEIDVMRRIKSVGCHPNLICLRDFFYYENYVAIVSDYILGETLLKLSSNFFQNFWDFFFIFKKSVDILHDLHRVDITHLDIKPENMIITHIENIPNVQKEFYNLSIIDFGASCFTSSQCKPITWTYGYFPPSFFDYIPTSQPFTLEYAKSYDIFSLGMTMYTILYNENPLLQIQNDKDLYNDKLDEIINKLKNGDPEFLQKFRNRYPNTRFINDEEAKHILSEFNLVILQMINPNDNIRIKINTLKDICDRLLRPFPPIKNKFDNYDNLAKEKLTKLNQKYIDNKYKTLNGQIGADYTIDRIKKASDNIVAEYAERTFPEQIKPVREQSTLQFTKKFVKEEYNDVIEGAKRNPPRNP